MVFDLSRTVDYRLFFLPNPERIIIDISDTSLAATIPTAFVPPLAAIRHGKSESHTSRIVVELTTPSKISSFLLKPQQQHGHRLVVDIVPRSKAAPSVAPSPAPSTENRDVIIAIDAGHGGEDYGAIASNINEKDLVLAYAKALAREINGRTGMKAVLVREGDYFIPLGKRMQIARQHNADLFLSIHANSFVPDRRVNGFLLFALSDKGASSEVGRWLARKENKSNLSGGVNTIINHEITDKSLRKVILDLSMTSVKNLSVLAGKRILTSMGTVTKLQKDYVEFANFTVLRAPDIPALLVELGFLTNPKEAQKLLRGQFRSRMTRALADGVENFFLSYPPHGSLLAVRRANLLNNAKEFYKVRYGDTLSEVALAHNLSTNELRRLNKLDSDRLLVGQQLRLRPDLGTQSRSPKHYTVQKGDSLSTIASQFRLTVAHLKKVNGLTKTSIRPGQKLLLHSPAAAQSP